MVDENLPNYWNSLSGLDQKRWFTREAHLRDFIHVKTMGDDQFEMLRKEKRK